MAAAYQVVRTADGRDLDVLVSGAAGGDVVVYHSGTPTGSVPFPNLDDPAAERGLQIVTYCRPGYGNSTPQPGRTVADAAGDVAAVLDALGLGSFATVGWSGGGPHALACAALMADRCTAAATVGGVAPFGVDGLDWTAGMADENVQEFTAAEAGVDALTEHLADAGFEEVTAESVAESFGGLVSDVDLAATTGSVAEYLASGLRRAVLNGTDGWRDDDLAFMTQWGFELREIAVPVAVWQGAQDRMVPFAHGELLARALPGARPHLLPDEGHISLTLQFGPILDDLLTLRRH